MPRFSRRSLAGAAVALAAAPAVAAVPGVSPDAELIRLCADFTRNRIAELEVRATCTLEERRRRAAAEVEAMRRGEPDLLDLRLAEIARHAASTSAGLRAKAEALSATYYGTAAPPARIGAATDQALASLLRDLLAA